MKKKTRWLVGAFGVIGILFGTTMDVGAGNCHYPLGADSNLTSALPFPGLSYRVGNVFYKADTLKDDHGNDENLDFDLAAFTNVHGFVYVMKDKKVLGADWGMRIIFPISSMDLQIKVPGGGPTLVDDSQIELGDISIEPMILTWRKPNYDITTSVRYWAATGDFDFQRGCNCGLGFWTLGFELGMNYFFDKARTWYAGVNAWLLFNGEQEDTELEPGTQLVLEYGLGKMVPITQNTLLGLGIGGYAFWQVEDDSGPGATDLRDRKYGIGPEFHVVHLPSKWTVMVKAFQDFGTRNDCDGYTLSIDLLKSF